MPAYFRGGAGAAFAEKPETQLLENSATMNIKFKVNDFVFLDYKFKEHGKSIPSTPDFEMGNANGKIKKGSCEFHLVDCSYCNCGNGTIVTIEFKPRNPGGGFLDLDAVKEDKWKWRCENTK